MAERAYEKGKATVENLAHRAEDKARDAGETVRDYADKASHKVEQSVHDYPLATLAGAAVAGLLIGALIRR